MKKYLFFLFCLIGVHVFAQKINEQDLKKLHKIEDSLTPLSVQMIRDVDPTGRFHSDSVFIRMFVRALKIPYSYEYPFDSIVTISKLVAPDNSFRIFTWEIERDESYFRQYGAIQMRTEDGSLKLFPLYDESDYAAVPTDSVRSSQNWIGAIYYQILLKEFNGKKYYTLIGLDDNDFESTKKWIEVLTFDKDGKPVFGGRYFDYKPDLHKPPQPAYRFCLEFKKDAQARMRFDPDLDMIIFDELISSTNEENKKYTLIPDGEYQGFKWLDGKWVFVSHPFGNISNTDDKTPLPKPFYDDNGKPKNF